MATEFGIAVRRLRIERGELLRDMAARVGRSSAFLSAVENGKKRVPDALVEAIEQRYALSEDERKMLRTAAAKANREAMEIKVSGVSQETRELVMTFARNFDAMPSERQDKLRKLLKDDDS